MVPIPSASTWGSPTATKHALLLHGQTSSSHSWYKVAASLASQGYFVTAPNLLGHASRFSTDYRVNTIAEDLLPYITARNYDLIIGHSLGGITAMALFRHLPQSHPTAFVLVDPALHLTPEQVDLFEKVFTDAVVKAQPPEAHLTAYPLWSREDGIMRELALRLCSPETVHGVQRHNHPFDFTDNFNPISPKWKVTVLIAGDATLKEYLAENDIKFPSPVRSLVVPGASHWIQCDFPEVVIEEALKTVAELGGV